jgi:hypothetical protein
MPMSSDQQWVDVIGLDLWWSRLAYTGRIYPVGLGKVSDAAVILGETS